MSRLPLLVGENPSRTGDRYWQFPLSGLVGKTLCDCAGIEPSPDGSKYGRYYWELRERFDCVNVFERYASATPWSVPKAREAWSTWLLTEAKPEEPLVVVCLGRKVAQAVGHDRPYGIWAETGLLQVVLAPHPSGANRMLNDAVYRAMLGRILREAVARA